VVVQGFGNVGSVAANLLANDGAKIVAVSDVNGGVQNPAGLDLPKLFEHLAKNKTVTGFAGGTPIQGKDLLEIPCDILIPAALENQITKSNAGKIKARIIAEGANGPTTTQADKILNKAGVLVIPDILANSGGVTVSYFEWVQDRQGLFWREEEVNDRLEHIMVNAFRDVARVADEHKVSLRVAAFMLAIKRVVDAIQLRGVYA
jgi:glutamate dehydrogenase (NAD(P)+)